MIIKFIELEPSQEIHSIIKEIIDEIKNETIFNSKKIDFEKSFNKVSDDINNLIKSANKNNVSKKEQPIKKVHIEPKKTNEFSGVLNIEHVI